jgi:hypothetical protein
VGAKAAVNGLPVVWLLRPATPYAALSAEQTAHLEAVHPELKCVGELERERFAARLARELGDRSNRRFGTHSNCFAPQPHAARSKRGLPLQPNVVGQAEVATFARFDFADAALGIDLVGLLQRLARPRCLGVLSAFSAEASAVVHARALGEAVASGSLPATRASLSALLRQLYAFARGAAPAAASCGGGGARAPFCCAAAT